MSDPEKFLVRWSPRKRAALPDAPEVGAPKPGAGTTGEGVRAPTVPEAEAGDYIGGYVIFNDVTARDIQREEMKSGVFSFCKAIDSFCPLGPHIVTADEIRDPHNLAMELRVNGEPRQRSHSGKMAVKIPQIIAHYSPMGYSAGDVLSTGTLRTLPWGAGTKVSVSLHTDCRLARWAMTSEAGMMTRWQAPIDGLVSDTSLTPIHAAFVSILGTERD